MATCEVCGRESRQTIELGPGWKGTGAEGARVCARSGEGCDLLSLTDDEVVERVRSRRAAVQRRHATRSPRKITASAVTVSGADMLIAVISGSGR